MAGVKANEREFAGQVVSWLGEAISQGSYPFTAASSETSLKVSPNTTNFPDIQIWLNREAGMGFCGWELKTPATPADDKTLLEDSARKARAMNADYFVTWNMRDAIIWRTPNSLEQVSNVHRQKTYPAIVAITDVNDLWVASKKELLKGRAQDILHDLSVLHNAGHLHLVDVDATFFVHILTETTWKLIPHIRESLQAKIGSDKKFRVGLFDWAVKQAIANYDDPTFYETVSRQFVYRLLGKLLFYHTLRRFRSDLPVLNLTDTDPSKINVKLREYFELARQIDYQAVFEEDFTDSIQIPASCLKILATLLEDLNRFNFSNMPHDVIGNVFEKLIPPLERHLLGQYFTKEELVDLINAFCIQTKDSKVIDPTCGTGTFLIRGYDRLKNLGEKAHTTLLSSLWGFDVAHFPAELATINLFRQNLSDYGNFPRVLPRDFFDVTPDAIFKFPPPKVMGSGGGMMEEKIPVFDAAVGNFPYIKQELIEKTSKGYKKKLATVLGKEWRDKYPELFSNGDLKLSGQADIYAYLFFHTAAFLKEDGGRMGIVTSNSWLDVEYGYELQKFFLRNFKIIAIMESRCEPWFEDAAINTVVTILERTPLTINAKDARDSHLVKFVKIKKRLKNLVPWDMKMEATRRWTAFDGLVHGVERTRSEYLKIMETGVATYEDDNFRIRAVAQGWLLKNLETTGRAMKWGQYLRAPEVYFEILEKCKERLVSLKELADVRRGYTTGINDFFYLEKDTIKHWGIEREFLAPVIKSPKESNSILIEEKDLEKFVFLCGLSTDELRKKGKRGALAYIKWGEKQVTMPRKGKGGGVGYAETPTVKNRQFWYSLPIHTKGNIFWTKSYNDTFLQRFSNESIFVDQRVYQIIERQGVSSSLLAAVLNSTLFAMGIEITGRVNLGEGALDTAVEESSNISCPDLRQFNNKIATKIERQFLSIISRPIKPIFQEVKMKDRQTLDSLVLNAIGLDPKKYLEPIYDGLCGLVRERLDLAGMRKKARKSKTEKDTEKLVTQVMDEVIPNGARNFPEEFIDSGYLKNTKEISISNQPLKLGAYFMGQQEVVAEGGYKYTAGSIEEAKFIIYSQRPNNFVVKLPKDKIKLTKAVDKYERYLQALKGELFEAFFSRTHDHKLADTLVARVVEMNSLA